MRELKKFGQEPADMLPIGFCIFLAFPLLVVAAVCLAPILLLWMLFEDATGGAGKRGARSFAASLERHRARFKD